MRSAGASLIFGRRGMAVLCALIFSATRWTAPAGSIRSPQRTTDKLEMVELCTCLRGYPRRGGHHAVSAELPDRIRRGRHRTIRCTKRSARGRKHAGIEHWLGFFHDKLETLFDYLPDASVTLDDQSTASRISRWDGIADQYDNRREALATKGAIDSVL